MPDTPTTVEEIQERVRRARADGRGIRPLGGGAQAHIGNRPALPLEALPVSGLRRVIEYTPDDMVVIAQAGMTLSDLQARLGQHGQWLPVECALAATQTIGGIVATRASSLCRAGHGSVRDWLIGLQVVGGDGQLVRGGGRVVKNVSGYDLPKLYCGSWGTLGVITEVAFKVAPQPEARAVTLAILAADRNSEETLDGLLNAAEPLQTSLMNGDAAKLLLGADSADPQYLIVRTEGPPEAVAAQTERIERALTPFAQTILNLPDHVSAPVLDGLRDFPLRAATLTVEFHVLSSQVGAFARMVEWTASRYGFRAAVVAECRTGVLHAHIEPADPDNAAWMKLLPDFTDKAQRVGGSYILQRMPEAWRDAGVPVWSPVLGEMKLMRGIKSALDPGGIFSPGCFAGGI